METAVLTVLSVLSLLSVATILSVVWLGKLTWCDHKRLNGHRKRLNAHSARLAELESEKPSPVMVPMPKPSETKQPVRRRTASELRRELEAPAQETAA